MAKGNGSTRSSSSSAPRGISAPQSNGEGKIEYSKLSDFNSSIRPELRDAVKLAKKENTNVYVDSDYDDQTYITTDPYTLEREGRAIATILPNGKIVRGFVK